MWRTHSCVPCPHSCGHAFLSAGKGASPGVGTRHAEACATPPRRLSVAGPTFVRSPPFSPASRRATLSVMKLFAAPLWAGAPPPRASRRATLSVMNLFAALLGAGTACLLSAQPQQAVNPFLGRWDFTIAPERANWLGVTAKDGALEIWFQPTGGNVYQVKDFKPAGSHLTLNLQKAGAKNPALTWELDAAGDRLTGIQKRGENQIQLTGVRVSRS